MALFWRDSHSFDVLKAPAVDPFAAQTYISAFACVGAATAQDAGLLRGPREGEPRARAARAEREPSAPSRERTSEQAQAPAGWTATIFSVPFAGLSVVWESAMCRFGWVFVALFCLVPSMPALAAVGPMNDAGYFWVDGHEEGVDFIDPQLTEPTVFALEGMSTVPIQLPFLFNYFGKVYDHASVTADGRLELRFRTQVPFPDHKRLVALFLKQFGQCNLRCIEAKEPMRLSFLINTHIQAATLRVRTRQECST